MEKQKKERDPDALMARALRRIQADIVSGAANRKGVEDLGVAIYQTGELTSAAYYAWQYDHNPAGLPFVSFAKKAEQVIGQFTVIPQKYSLIGQPALGGVVLNVMTHPDYRGRGIFMVLAEEVFKECHTRKNKFSIGFPNPNAYKGYMRHLSFTEVGSVPLWILPFNLTALKSAHQVTEKAWLKPLLDIGQLAWSGPFSFLTRRWIKNPVSVKKLQGFDDSFTQFWERAKPANKHVLVRDRTFLDWRYSQHPLRKYGIFAAYENNEMIGYLISRVMDVEGVRCGMIVDVFLESSERGKKAGRELVSAVGKEFVQERVALSGSLSLENTDLADALNWAGYLKCPESLLPQPFPVILRWHGDEPAPNGFFDLKNWILTMGDYDVI